MERLLNKGEVHMNTLAYYREEEENEVKLIDIVDERVLHGFGDTAVIIHDAVDFVSRVKKASLKQGLIHARYSVKYEDINTRHGEVDIFEKDLSFSYQKELRIAAFDKEAVFDKESEPGPMTLNIGSIKGIACLISAQEVAEITIEPCNSE
jgi:hypothetical protein